MKAISRDLANCQLFPSIVNTRGTEMAESSQKTYGCLWQDCGFETPHSDDMVRHLNFHSFHTKIKSVGLVILKGKLFRFIVFFFFFF